MPIISNPGNPTGHTRSGEELKELIEMAEAAKSGILLDEVRIFGMMIHLLLGFNLTFFFLRRTKCFTLPQ